MKKLLLFAVAILFAGSAWAQDFNKDGIYYNILSENTVEVTHNGIGTTYENTISIPAVVIHPTTNVAYTVVKIGNSAFEGYDNVLFNTSRVYNVYVPSTITTIGSKAFYEMRNNSLTGSDVTLNFLADNAPSYSGDATNIFWKGEDYLFWTGKDSENEQIDNLIYPNGSTSYNSWGNFNNRTSTTNYTLTFDLDGGAFATGIPTSFEVRNGYLVRASNFPTPTKDGFSFNGWTMNAVSVPAEFTTNNWNANTTITAEWIAQEYTLTYDANCDFGVTPVGPAGLPTCAAPAGQTFSTLDAVTLDVTMTKGGYTFAGWYTNEDLTEGPITTIPAGTTHDVTVYAKWEASSFAVTYIDPIALVEGALAPATITGLTPATFTFGEETAPALPATIEKVGYTFDGWNPEAINTLYAGAQEFKANWIANTYNVVYNANDGVGENTQTITYDAWRTEAGVLIFNGNTYTKTGFTLKGWNTEINGTGTNYALEQRLDHDLATEGEVTLYAIWEADDFALTFNEAGGTMVESIKPTYNQAIGTLPTSTQDGMAFIGWYIDGEKITAETIWNFDEPKTAYAVWYKALEQKADCEGNENGRIKVKFKTNSIIDITFNVTIEGNEREFTTGDVMNFRFEDLAAGDYTVVVEGADNTFDAVNIHNFNFTFTSIPDLTLPVQGGEAVVFTAIGNGDYTWNHTPALYAVDNNERIDIMKTFTEATEVSVTGRYEAIGGGACEKTMTLEVDVQVCPEATATDVDGNEYDVFDFDGKCWFRENLRAENYAPVAGEETVAIPFARVYEHPEVSEVPESYGKLYNWTSAANGTSVSPLLVGRQGACPEGWRLPTAGDLNAMTQYTSTQLRTDEAGWINGVGTNETGFTAEPAGVYNSGLQRFEKIYSRTGFWSSDINANGEATYGQICYTCNQFTMEQTANPIGLSVRCIQVIEPLVYVTEATTAGIKGFFARGSYDLSGIEFRAEGATEWTVINAETFESYGFEFAADLAAGTYEYRAVVKNLEDVLYAGETQTFVVE